MTHNTGPFYGFVSTGSSIFYAHYESMNIVKGVAGLLRKTSTGQAGENRVGSQAEGFSTPPWPEIEFGYFLLSFQQCYFWCAHVFCIYINNKPNISSKVPRIFFCNCEITKDIFFVIMNISKYLYDQEIIVFILFTLLGCFLSWKSNTKAMIY